MKTREELETLVRDSEGNPHTTAAMRVVSLAQYLGVPESSIQEWPECPHLFSHDGTDYAVSAVEHPLELQNAMFVALALGHNIWRLG